MTRAIITQIVEALEGLANTHQQGRSVAAEGAFGYVEMHVQNAEGAITAAREYLATEPSAERAELLHALSGHIGWANTVGYAELGKSLRKSADMLEADAQQAKQVPMTDQQITNWYASENGLEECSMCKYDDFKKVVRAVERRIGGEA